jgi:glutamate N-acetyltransferase/amino-acid N-acetyltransferase
MISQITNGSITDVEGFKANGVHCGLKKKKKDLALITSDVPANAAGTFTLNKVKAAPLLISRKIINEDQKIKAVLVNSGNANACTGEKGYNDALDIQSYCAEKLDLNQNEVLISSTGVIGQYINVDAVKTGVDEIVNSLKDDGGINAAEAIMTTDLAKKHFAYKVKLSKGEITLGAICKGSGMIMPNMATMLAFIGTDADIDKSLLQKLLINAVDNSFNKISVDGETSTNDMVVLLANGISDIKVETASDDEKIFADALQKICKDMAKAIIADGEGATKLITINVSNAASSKDADKIARALANSPLVKTAMYGEDANWGRIISSAGSSGANFNPDNVEIYFDDKPVLLSGYRVVINEDEVKTVLSKKEISINIDVNEGSENTTWWTCDYSENYIKINALYRS